VPLEHLLAAAAAIVPTWRVAYRHGNIPERSFKVEWKRALALASPRRTTAPPRAATALELLRVCRELQGRFEEVELPLLAAHGGDDMRRWRSRRGSIRWASCCYQLWASVLCLMKCRQERGWW
jgi:hypothetical protein